MSRIILITLFLCFVNKVYSQFFYFQNPENVTLVNYNLENWRNLDENEIREKSKHGSIIYVLDDKEIKEKSKHGSSKFFINGDLTNEQLSALFAIL